MGSNLALTHKEAKRRRGSELLKELVPVPGLFRLQELSHGGLNGLSTPEEKKQKSLTI